MTNVPAMTDEATIMPTLSGFTGSIGSLPVVLPVVVVIDPVVVSTPVVASAVVPVVATPVVEGNAVSLTTTLNGSVSTYSDVTIVSYLWTKVQGSGLVISSPN